MKILTVTSFSLSKQGSVIIPILKNEALNEALKKIAKVYQVSEQRLLTDVKGDFKEMTNFYVGDTRISLLGLGEKPSVADTITAFRNFSFSQKGRLNGGTLTLDYIHSTANPDIFSAINGLMLGIYRVGLYKSESNGNHPLANETVELRLLINTPAIEAQADAEKGILMAETQRRIMDLVNAAPNQKTPQYLADWAQDSGEKYGYTVTSFDKKTCEEKGLKALLSVNAGSPNEPRFIIIEYKAIEAKAKIGLIGKGVTFDTGGVSIKAATNMHLMKSDMGGAAAVFGAIEMAAKLKLPVHLIGIVPATENSVDGLGTKPGDVIGSYAGKTIEVIDTDAEGRLILADGLSYMAKEFKPEVMIDLATLTGNVIAALGYQAAGLFANNETLATALTQAGDFSGERVWRLPLWENYFDDMKSDIADIANLSSKPLAGSITAAKFLEFFIEKHPAWAHLDIAGMALATTELGTHRTATAYGVRLLTAFLEHWVKKAI
jgi:leucyl aminopeptidase